MVENKNILVVEDDPDIRELISSKLKQLSLLFII